VYKPKKGDDSETYGGEEDLKKLQDTSKFKPDKDFSGVNRDKPAVVWFGGRFANFVQEPRNEPVQFEKDDPFGLDEFLSQAKTGSKSALDKIGTSGHMQVGSANLEVASEGGSKRGRLDFEPESGRDRQKDSKKRK
jgi:SNW domain-containing protein 1